MFKEPFIQELADEVFDEGVTVVREAGGSLDDHSHPFKAKALILEGELRIRTADAECRYGAGDVFHLAAHVPHSEVYGPAGVTYLVGRKK